MNCDIRTSFRSLCNRPTRKEITKMPTSSRLRVQLLGDGGFYNNVTPLESFLISCGFNFNVYSLIHILFDCLEKFINNEHRLQRSNMFIELLPYNFFTRGDMQGASLRLVIAIFLF